VKSLLTNLLLATVILLATAVGSLITVDAGLSSDQIIPHYADTQLAKDGLKAYNQAGCASCHSFFGQQGQVGGPRLDWIGERYNQDILEQVIKNPRNFYPNTIMPPIHSRFTDEDVALIAEYLASFKRN
jgi:mono/diheme cytochrome c family protein